MGDGDSSEMEISFETLYELLRKEKYREEVQKIKPSFFAELVGFVAAQVKLLKASEGRIDLFNATEKSRLKNEVSQVVELVNEIYDRRERKIMNLAINKSRSRSTSSIVDTSNLLPEEKKLFIELDGVLSRYREGILLSILSGKEPVVSGITQSQPLAAPKTDAADEASADSTGDQTEKPTTRMIRFTHAVPKFVGKELEVYGPFDVDNVANLPVEIADLLIRKGRAEEMTSE